MRTHFKLLSRIGQGTFYVESVSLASGKGGRACRKPIIHQRNSALPVCAPFRNQLNRVILLSKRQAESVYRANVTKTTEIADRGRPTEITIEEGEG